MHERIAALNAGRGHRRQALDRLIRWSEPQMAGVLPEGSGLNPLALLGALAWQESTFGHDGGQARREPAYRPGGRYYLRSPHVRAIHAQYGDSGASSWSSFQILYVAAWELGYDGPPWGLHSDAEALRWVIRYLVKRVFGPGARTVEEVADSYNSGTHTDENKVPEYVESFRAHYDRCIERLGRGLPLGP